MASLKTVFRTQPNSGFQVLKRKIGVSPNGMGCSERVPNILAIGSRFVRLNEVLDRQIEIAPVQLRHTEKVVIDASW